MSKLPEKWKILSIGDFAKTSAGGTPSTQIQEYWEGGDIPWMSSGEVHKKRVFAVDGRITQSGYGNSSAKLFPPKTILMALAGQGKTRGTVAISEIELTTNQSIAGISVTAKNVSPDFVYHNLDSRYDELRGVSGGSGRAGLNLTIINEQELLLPPLPEQKKIAAILTSVDDVIEKTQAQIDKLKDLKTGMMQELLTRGVGVDGKPHTEFKDSPMGRIPKGWNCCLLDKVAKRGSGHTPDKKKPEYWNDGIKWVSLTDSSKLDKLYISETAKKISQLGIENSSATLHPKGTVVMARDAGVGKSAIMTSSMAVSQHFMAWVCGEKLDNYFLYYLLQHWKPQFEAIAMGSTIKTIGLPYFKKLQIPVPSVEEQRVISGALNSVDNKMFALERKHKQLTSTKKALMQDLLTGKVRVKVDS
ncbi:restriction endonuclease subunit S [Vibrio sp. 10N.222.49.A3]|uniref:restriction endonuclease subunit S n=1 Tax=Vibrio sp. 10N.222.49.A3 TaxID=3229611 RepID=UPI00354E6889